MANYDDIFNASAQKGTEDKSFVSFNKEEWAAQKKQERESAFAMIDETAQRMANDCGLFQSYLDVQARFDRYSVGNAVLITAQKADATQLSDFKGWKNNGVFIKKGESGIVLLEPGEEYTKDNILDIRKRIGWVSSSFFDKTYTQESVFDIVISALTGAMGRDFNVSNKDIAKARLLLESLGLKTKIDSSFTTLSKGERQNVLIARAFMTNPEIMILDEPATGLDVLAREVLLATIKELAENQNTTMIYVTHYPHELPACVDKRFELVKHA